MNATSWTCGTRQAETSDLHQGLSSSESLANPALTPANLTEKNKRFRIRTLNVLAWGPESAGCPTSTWTLVGMHPGPVSRLLTLLLVPQVCLEVRVAGCGPTVGRCPSPDLRGRRQAKAGLTTAQTACWSKTPEAGSPQAAPPKLSVRSSVHRRLTLTERHSAYLLLSAPSRRPVWTLCLSHI